MYLWPGKVPFANGPYIRLDCLMSDNYKLERGGGGGGTLIFGNSGDVRPTDEWMIISES